ncbi:hypothetical protein I4U23_017624 [Adineta vaga]|nr:hypothetical protein I4U23_017624 [Adineta vaga]
MASLNDNETGFSENDIHFARQTFFRDCPNGFCSKRKFLTFLRKSSVYPSFQKSTRSNILVQILLTRQTYRQSRKFFSMMFDIYDRNHDGQLDFHEYLYALSALTGANRLRTIETLYNFFDNNNQGYITRQEFNSRKKLAAQFLGQYQPNINEHLLYEQAFNTIDTNQDGRITKEEFIQWYFQDHFTNDEIKPIKKRTRLLKNLTTLVDLRGGQIKTSSLQTIDQNKNSIDAWLETTLNNPHQQSEISSIPSSPMSINADRYLLKVLRRARNRFIQSRHSQSKRIIIDNQSDSGVFTSSSITNFNDNDDESDSLRDTDEDYLQSIETDDPTNELLCQSLEAVLMETLLELRQHRQRRSTNLNISRTMNNTEELVITRL